MLKELFKGRIIGILQSRNRQERGLRAIVIVGVHIRFNVAAEQIFGPFVHVEEHRLFGHEHAAPEVIHFRFLLTDILLLGWDGPYFLENLYLLRKPSNHKLLGALMDGSVAAWNITLGPVNDDSVVPEDVLHPLMELVNILPKEVLNVKPTGVIEVVPGEFINHLIQLFVRPMLFVPKLGEVIPHRVLCVIIGLVVDVRMPLQQLQHLLIAHQHHMAHISVGGAVDANGMV